MKDFNILGDFTVTVKDGTGSPLTYVIRTEPGKTSLTWAAPPQEQVWQRATTGAYDGAPRLGPPTAPAKLTIGPIRVNDPGVHTSEAVVKDIYDNTGFVGSTWVTTESGSDLDGYIIVLNAAARTNGVAAQTYTFTDYYIDGSEGRTHSIEPDGHWITLTFLGAAAPVHTRA